MEGLALALQWTNLPIVLETDCSQVIALLSGTSKGRSRCCNLIEECRRCMNQDREIVIVKASRSQNRVSHGGFLQCLMM